MAALTPQQKRDVALILGAGCDRQTAAHFVGCDVPTLNREAQGDPDFSAEMLRSEAGCELSHMRTLQQASRDPKHWRSSVWWLERHSPDRFGSRRADAIGRVEVSRFVASLAEAIAAVVRAKADRQRLLSHIDELAHQIGAPSAPLAIEEEKREVE